MHQFLRFLTLLGGLTFFFLVGIVLANPGNVRGSTLVVTTTANSGPGSLRQALADANGGDTIQFDPALNGQTISLTTGGLGLNKDITINGPGPTLLAVVRASEAFFPIFQTTPDHTVVIEGLTIAGGLGDGQAGGIYNDGATLTINNCIVRNNIAQHGYGGGISNDGTLTITNSTIRDNFATFTLIGNGGSGGGIYNVGTLTISHSTITGNVTAMVPERVGRGGGIWSTAGNVEITNSTISLNRADASGGGIISVGSLTITNSTISGNIVNDDGGGIASGGPLTITNSTISGNSANGIGGGIWSTGNNATLEIENTILNTGTAGANVVSDSGTVTSHGYNLSNDNGGGFLIGPGDQINTSPTLGPLQDNGGPTFTHELLIGSPAINAGDPNFTPPPFDDQRGAPYLRVSNGRIDIGSVEGQPAPTPTPTPTPTATPTPTGTPTPTPMPSSTPARALNMSTRLRVETGERVMIGGFIITGNATKDMAIRGLGPSLAGSAISDVLTDPVLELREANGSLLYQNDNWQDNPAQAAQLTALGLAPQNPNESGVVATLQPGASYTAIVAGANGGSGVGLVEIYDVNPTANSQLANISTRGLVQTGDNVMIGGFILGGSNQNTAVVVRGIGPSLAPFGLSNLLADPTLELRDGNGMLLIANDNWQDDSASAAQLTVHGLAPQNPLESGIFASLPSGAFTAILSGKNSGIGIGLIEIYNVQ